MIKAPYNDPLEAGVDGRALLRDVNNIKDILDEKGLEWFNAPRSETGGFSAAKGVRRLLKYRRRPTEQTGGCLATTDGFILVGHNDDGACEMIYPVPSAAAIAANWHNARQRLDLGLLADIAEEILDAYQNDCGGTDVIGFDAVTGERRPTMDMP
jgi:hypothetical protein